MTVFICLHDGRFFLVKTHVVLWKNITNKTFKSKFMCFYFFEQIAIYIYYSTNKVRNKTKSISVDITVYIYTKSNLDIVWIPYSKCLILMHKKR